MIVSPHRSKEWNAVQEIVKDIETKVTSSPHKPPKPSELESLTLIRPSIFKNRACSTSLRDVNMYVAEVECSEPTTSDMKDNGEGESNIKIMELMDVISSQKQLLAEYQADAAASQDVSAQDRRRYEEIISNLQSAIEAAQLQLQEKQTVVTSCQLDIEAMVAETLNMKSDHDVVVARLSDERDLLRLQLMEESRRSLAATNELETLKALHGTAVCAMDSERTFLSSEVQSLTERLHVQDMQMASMNREYDDRVRELSSLVESVQTDLSCAQEEVVTKGELVAAKDAEITDLNRTKLALLEWIRSSCDDSTNSDSLSTLISQLFPQGASDMTLSFPSE